MSAHFQRAAMLFDQGKYDLAEQELRQSLAEDPDLGPAHALLSLCLAEREQFNEAEEEAKQAVHLEPESSLSHLALAKVLEERRRPAEALRAIEEAIRLDPVDADLHASHAQILYNQRRWPRALEAAEKGLEFDPEHPGCSNLRAMALVKLGRKAEAGRTIDAALARDPEDAGSHAVQGWALLDRGDPNKALEHFRESLRLDPTSEFARAGIVEAMKARNPIYGLFLRYFLFMAKLGGKAQWAIIIGAFLGMRVLRGIEKSNPELEPFILPITIVYVVFALMTWIAAPLFNLLLRLSRFGRLALSREQVVASNWIGTCVLLALVTLGLWLATGSELALLGAMLFGALLIPLAGTFNCDRGWPRTAMAMFTAALFLLPVIGLGLMISSPEEHADTASNLMIIGLVGAMLSGWVANGLMMITPRR